MDLTRLFYPQSVAVLSAAVQGKIGEKIPGVNTSTANPVDLGAGGFESKVMIHTMQAMAPEPNLDVLVPYFALDFVSMFPDEAIEKGFREIAAAARDLSLPVVPIIFKSYENKPRLEAVRMTALTIFREAGLPVFFTPQDAVLAMARMLEWKGEV